MVSDAAAEIAKFYTAPIILFGHSMGSMLAFEVARSLRREHCIEVDALVVSGHCAPQLEPRSPSVHHLEGRQLLERLGELYGAVPSEALDEPELIELMAHVAKADLTLSATYRYVEESPLNCLVQVFGGKSDPWVNADELAQWNRQTTGPFNATLLSGGHFYLQEQMMERILLTRLIHVCESSRKR